MDKEQLLVIDDDQGLLKLLTMRLEAMGFAVTACHDANTALDEARRQRFDLVMTDLRLGQGDGLAVMEEVRTLHPDLPVLILTAHGSIPGAVEAMHKGAVGYLTKPFEDRDLSLWIGKALAPRRMSREIQRLRQLVSELYGLEHVAAKSPAMQSLLQQVARVADTDATICLNGETGTGKEVIARVIHCNSQRAGGSFVPVNCGAIPESLFESELFGHVKGAFTGAVGSSRGLFQSADGGTLFLDEIGEMPPAVQVKMLRVLQTREVLEVGGTRPVKVDVRIITATNKDLAQAVKAGSFREDLFYRIQVIPLTVPPLRARRDDIPLLAQLFLRQSIERAGKIVRGFTPDAMQKLMSYHWPGNVRELEHAVEKAVILTPRDMVTADLLPGGSGATDGPVRPLTEAREEFERNYLRELLELSSGNISRASQMAGRYRADFYKLLRKYGLHPSDGRARSAVRMEGAALQGPAAGEGIAPRTAAEG
jgi:two-component system response regulator GlrR